MSRGRDARCQATDATELSSTTTLPQSRAQMLSPGRDTILQPGDTASARPAGRTGLGPTGKCKLSLRQTGRSLPFSKLPRGVGLKGRHRIFTEGTSPNLWAGRRTSGRRPSLDTERKGHPTAQRGPSRGYSSSSWLRWDPGTSLLSR